jgi:hypothetical protein
MASPKKRKVEDMERKSPNSPNSSTSPTLPTPQFYVIVLTGCNKMEPVFAQVTATLVEAEKYLETVATFEPVTDEFCGDGDDIIKVLYKTPAEAIEIFDYACFKVTNAEWFDHKVYSNACRNQTCARNAYVFESPDGDLLEINRHLRDLVW